MLNNLERSLQKVKYVLTPKKPHDNGGTVAPAVLTTKNLCNVSTTQCKDAELVIGELKTGLAKKGIGCFRKGFRLKGSLEPPTVGRLGGCSFELEICYLPPLSAAASSAKPPPSDGTFYVGIRRRRLKGDSWCYKKVCEEVLALTCAGFSGKETAKESAV